MIESSLANPVIIPLEGTEGYKNSITMDIPDTIIGSSSAFTTEHIYEVAINGTTNGANWILAVFLRSYGAARPTDPINVSAGTNIDYFKSKNMEAVSDTIVESQNCGLCRDQEFRGSNGSHIIVRTFLLDKKHVAFVMSPFDEDTTSKMFDSIVPGTSDSMYYV
jgi:hypothetical protein